MANTLRANDWTVIRSAGSKGKFDLIAIRKNKILALQLKKHKLSDNARLKLIRELLDEIPEGYYHLSPKLLTGSLRDMKETINEW